MISELTNNGNPFILNMRDNQKECEIMKLYELTEKEFREFLNNHPLKSFLQTPEIATLREKNGWQKYYVGLKEKDQLIGATMMIAGGNFMGKKIFYAPRGILIDFEKQDILKTFVFEIKNFIKKHGGYVFRMDPYYELKEHDIDGKVVENGFDHTETLRYLESLGFKVLEKAEQLKWMFALDIEGKSIEELRRNFRQNTRNIINKTLKSNIIVRELSYEELSVFKKLTEETSERKNFSDKSLTYYQDMYQLFHPMNQIKYLIAEIHFPEYIQSLEEEKRALQERITKLTDSKANDGKRKEMNISIESIDKKLEEAKSIQAENGDVLVLSGGMFILYGDEVVYLFSGNYKKYMQFNAQYLIQWEMINYAVDHHYKRYNFYGITGIFDKKHKDYGMYEFKKGFNGYVIELIGELELPISFHYQIHQILSSIKAKMKGKK